MPEVDGCVCAPFHALQGAVPQGVCYEGTRQLYMRALASNFLFSAGRQKQCSQCVGRHGVSVPTVSCLLACVFLLVFTQYWSSELLSQPLYCSGVIMQT